MCDAFMIVMWLT